ncbi:membrane protein-like protein [Chthoniobacter flavus Ellin428]|uniref:Membrane protein-like protein n=1 Tax=Chthoniobacter flavus Ellin428 TaxID=497964 RepID=B4D783_9BACT|nr:DUF2127 domain-containing protein [Chthoniobacter flavus]EDY17734.1 membrane protein-like protein [Chthoniobacter flavus Ellin428]TCO87059.1 uncharacterized membrane protein (DUF2068 family) [Chthoniobacter flavus]
MAPNPVPSSKEDRYLRVIAIYTVGKGLLLCLLAIGFLGFLHKDVDMIVGNWMSLLGFNMENRHVIAILARLDKVTDKQLRELSGITFAVAGVFLTQGSGLLLRQQWAKYLTVSVTSALIPVEIVELFRHFGWIKVGVLAVNIAIVAFLVVSLVREKRRTQLTKPALAAGPQPVAVSCETV